MHPSTWLSRCLPVASIAALSVVAVGAATFGHPGRTAATQRPAADAPVRVVHVPGTQRRTEPCRTCALAAGGWL